jgi:ribosomal protein L40E
MLELLAGIIVAVALMALVLEPLVRGRRWAPASGTLDGELDFSDIEESESPKVQALLAIKEIEFDRETGKLSDEDYSALKATYQRAALVAIKAEDGDGDGRTAGAVGVVCPTCGPRPETSATFCSECGQTLVGGALSVVCQACGELAPAGAKFCGECGATLNPS